MSIYDNDSTSIRKNYSAAVISENSYEDLNHILQTGADLADSIVYLCNEINELTLFDMIVRFRAIMKYRESFGSSQDYNAPINLLINSPGGSIYDMLAIVDFIQTFNVPVNTICRGAAFSAAAVILTCGTGTRVMSKRSSVMFHQSSNYLEGKFNDVKASLAFTQVIENDMYTLLASRTTQSDPLWWKEKMKTDFFLSAEEALQLGVIDSIV